MSESSSTDEITSTSTTTKSRTLPTSSSSNNDLTTKEGLLAAGYVLEVTARDPDVRDAKGKLISKGKIYDWYHHPCMPKDCTHDDVTLAGDWKRIETSDEKRCVN